MAQRKRRVDTFRSKSGISVVGGGLRLSRAGGAGDIRIRQIDPNARMIRGNFRVRPTAVPPLPDNTPVAAAFDRGLQDFTRIAIATSLRHQDEKDGLAASDELSGFANDLVKLHKGTPEVPGYASTRGSAATGQAFHDHMANMEKLFQDHYDKLGPNAKQKFHARGMRLLDQFREAATDHYMAQQDVAKSDSRIKAYSSLVDRLTIDGQAFEEGSNGVPEYLASFKTEKERTAGADQLALDVMNSIRTGTNSAAQMQNAYDGYLNELPMSPGRRSELQDLITAQEEYQKRQERSERIEEERRIADDNKERISLQVRKMSEGTFDPKEFSSEAALEQYFELDRPTVDAFKGMMQSYDQGTFTQKQLNVIQDFRDEFTSYLDGNTYFRDAFIIQEAQRRGIKNPSKYGDIIERNRWNRAEGDNEVHDFRNYINGQISNALKTIQIDNNFQNNALNQFTSELEDRENMTATDAAKSDMAIRNRIVQLNDLNSKVNTIASDNRLSNTEKLNKMNYLYSLAMPTEMTGNQYSSADQAKMFEVTRRLENKFFAETDALTSPEATKAMQEFKKTYGVDAQLDSELDRVIFSTPYSNQTIPYKEFKAVGKVPVVKELAAILDAKQEKINQKNMVALKDSLYADGYRYDPFMQKFRRQAFVDGTGAQAVVVAPVLDSSNYLPAPPTVEVVEEGELTRLNKKAADYFAPMFGLSPPENSEEVDDLEVLKEIWGGITDIFGTTTKEIKKRTTMQRR